MQQDPVLNRVKLIAEPWDIGPGGYQLGAYPSPFAEWNDKFRDHTRRFWRGDTRFASEMAGRLCGSALYFDHDGRPATSSVNFVTSHDGFTLMDTVSYNHKHNAANGEENRDGHGANFSDNLGIEGPTKDHAILSARSRRRRNLLATVLLSQGTPMLLAGDEIGNSQGGNNNAYCQDNEIGWVNWDDPDDAFFDFCCKAIAFRKAHPILRQRRFLHARSRLIDGTPDLFWWRADGVEMTPGDCHNPDLKLVIAEMRMASGTPRYVPKEGALLVVLNAGPATEITLPDAPAGARWLRQFDTASDDPTAPIMGSTIAASSVVVYFLDETTDPAKETDDAN